MARHMGKHMLWEQVSNWKICEKTGVDCLLKTSRRFAYLKIPFDNLQSQCYGGIKTLDVTQEYVKVKYLLKN